MSLEIALYSSSILQALVDDSAVICEKVGTSNYYCMSTNPHMKRSVRRSVFIFCRFRHSGSYPGATAARVQADFDNTEKAIVAAEKKLEETTQAFNAMRAARGMGGDDEKDQVCPLRSRDVRKTMH